MTIADIYDALAAGGRPFRRDLPEDRARDILAAAAGANRIDAAPYRVFVDRGAWRIKR